VISAYALVFGGFLLLGGRAADLLGRRRLFLAGLVVFTLSSLLAGFAWSEASLIAARALQGLGAAVITPAALSILSTTFVEGRERNIALGVWSAVGGFGAAAGLLAGGILTDTVGWEWIFFVNVPVGFAEPKRAPRVPCSSLLACRHLSTRSHRLGTTVGSRTRPSRSSQPHSPCSWASLPGSSDIRNR
jgi:MFS family permease